MTDPTFGMTITSVGTDPRATVTSNMSVIGLVITAPNADADAYPVNTPVLVNSSDEAAITALGVTGSHVGQVDLINSQLSGFNASALIIFVRVEEGVDDNATMINLIAGVKALEAAEASLGVAPRLIGIPQFTHQQATPATANPVIAGISATLERLVAHAVCTGPHSTLQAYTDWRETLSNRRVIPVETWVQVSFDGAALAAQLGAHIPDGLVPNTLEIDSVGGALGMIVARDNANGGKPFRGPANRPMQGIISANRPIPFSITDGNTEGQQILALNGGIIVRGEAGSATSLGSGGFTFVATDTASDDDLWRFFHVSRGRDYIHLLFLNTLKTYLGKSNITGQTVQAVMNTMGIALRDLKADGDILGYSVGFDPDQNSPENLRKGAFVVDFKAEEAPVLRKLDVRSYRYRAALDDLLTEIAAVASVAA